MMTLTKEGFAVRYPKCDKQLAKDSVKLAEFLVKQKAGQMTKPIIRSMI